MIPDDFRDRGIALAERVGVQVDADVGLDRLLGRRRRSRAVLAVASAAAVIAVVVVIFSVARSPSRPADSPTPLPFTVYLALLDEFVIENEGLGQCSGTGVHAEVVLGVEGALVDESGTVLDSFTIDEPGELIGPPRLGELGLETTEQACLFELVTTSIDVERIFVSPSIGDEQWPPAGVFEAGASEAGQQLVYYSRGEQP